MFDSHFNDGVRRPGNREMTAMLAGLMALNALAIDSMIPALPDIGRALDVAEANRRQLVVLAYFVGFASTQLVWGPLADRFGRKPVLAAGIVLYGIFGLVCAFAQSFALLIAGRVAMGASAAVTRVLVIAMVRDLFEGEAMARVMSLVFMTFMLVPVLAPNIGQGILLVASWRAIFLVLAGYAVVMLLWSWRRLPETLHPEYRRSLKWREMKEAVVTTVSEPQSRGYTIAVTIIFSSLVAYIASVQQIVFDAFHSPGPGYRSRRSLRRWRSPPGRTAGSSSATAFAASGISPQRRWFSSPPSMPRWRWPVARRCSASLSFRR